MFNIDKTTSLLCVCTTLGLLGCGQRPVQQSGTFDGASRSQDGSPADRTNPPDSCLIAIRLDR